MPLEHYIKVILPLRLEWEPCYTTATPVLSGDRVAVVFAGRRCVGVVSDPDAVPDIDASRIKPVLSVETGLESISAEEIALWRFIADYYLCTVGEVYKAAYPGLKTASEETSVRQREQREALAAKTVRIWQERVARLEQRLSSKQQALAGRHNETVRARLEEQRAVLARDLESARQHLASFSGDLSLAGSDYSGLLTCLQDIPANAGLQDALQAGKPLLLKSADRIPYYISAAAESLRNGRNVLVLVDEIALAAELRQRLEGAFGKLVLELHSAMSRASQRRINDVLRSGRPYILVGTRSAIFAANRDLGMIIVDNEESPFYKQSDLAPRYHARDCAVQLSRLHGCGIILGSASPSLESLQNTLSGRYALLEPPGAKAPGRFTLVDIAAEKRKNGMQGPLSRKLLDLMGRSNRTLLIRGYEKPEELEGLPADVMTIPQAAKSDISGYSLIALLSADAMFNATDFRSDEHTFQYLERLRSLSPQVLVQTWQAGHQVFRMSDARNLLNERREFSLPPFTRLVDLRGADARLQQNLAAAGFSCLAFDGGVRVVLKRNKTLQERKKELRRIISGVNCIVDVDPVSSGVQRP